MPKFCPICLSEYKNTVKVCPQDHANLVDKKPKDTEQLIDIYVAKNEIEAERIIAFLQDEMVMAHYSRTGISQLPVVSDTSFVISVKKEQARLAKIHIEDAREDSVISQSGNFL